MVTATLLDPVDPAGAASSDPTGDNVGNATRRMDDPVDEYDDDDPLIVGALATELDPNEGHCWSCFTKLRDDDGAKRPLYPTHEHPLLGVPVCCACNERTEAVEGEVLDAVESQENFDPMACSWCGREGDELAEEYSRMVEGSPYNDLLLCDNCPRAFCVRCVVLSLGGNESAVQQARETIASEGRWECCHCKSTPFLEKVQEAFKALSLVSPEDSSCENVEAKDNKMAALIEQLEMAEERKQYAANRTEGPEMLARRNELEDELVEESTDIDELEDSIDRSLEQYRKHWKDEYTRIYDKITCIQDEMEGLEPGIIEQFYKFREADISSRTAVDANAKLSAEEALNRRDEEDGFNRGEFRGASGYIPSDPNVLKLEPEDLDETCLGEIEDVNTLEGAVAQMQENSSKKSNPWTSKTGTTALDVEMFKKKAIKVEQLTLGGMIDLEKLEEKCVRDSEDAIVEKKEVAYSSGFVVRRRQSFRSKKRQTRKESTSSNLTNEEYQPRLPSAATMMKTPATIPKAKKRAALQHLSSRASFGGGASSGRLSPSSRGKTIGNSSATFEDSSIALPVDGCPKRISVCQPLSSLLKAHQREGLQFCWKNVCSKLMSCKQMDDKGAIHGAILAHNMGLGKSFQAVCLLHTILTHPSLVTAGGCPNDFGGTNSIKRIVHCALLLAPVNTLANWQVEFSKWLSPESGRRVPAIRFYQITGDKKNHIKIVKEWQESGGVLVCSAETFGSTCKAFVSKGGRKSPVPGKPTEETKLSKARDEKTKSDEALMRKALFDPGPDIVVLDEVHTMLKSDTSIIYRVLNGLKTRLRLGLTGSPLQNNLLEYYRLASWVRPNSLAASEAVFKREFFDPIMAGVPSDCSRAEAEKQEECTKKMQAILDEFVHRRDQSILAKDLPPLQQTIIHVRQSKAQIKLYREFRRYQRESGDKGFFKQYHALRPVANHPAVLFASKETDTKTNSPSVKSDEGKAEGKNDSEFTESGEPKTAPNKFAWLCDKCEIMSFKTYDECCEHEETCTGKPNAALELPSKCVPVKKKKSPEEGEWWASFKEKADRTSLDLKGIEHSGKIVMLLQIIAHCDAIGDKVVVFSQSLPTLSLIEEILQSPDWGGFKAYLPNTASKPKLGGWRRNQEYLRIDGQVQAAERGDLIDTFNSSGSHKSKLFLLSTEAGGLGINLVAANRVVLFDSHFNPAIDLQAIYRCYRYGQTKPTFCYRLLAEGSMEQKVFSRAAAKSNLSDLVIDKQNPARSYTQKEMDMLREEDTWVCCESCNKWRMLPPDCSADEVANLAEEWYCHMNHHDLERSVCDAPEKDALWYSKFWQRQREKKLREERLSQSQQVGGIESQDNAPALNWIPLVNDKCDKYTQRDVVLKALIDRSEENKTSASRDKTASTKSRSWLSRYEFATDKSDDLVPAVAAETNGPTKDSAATPTKKPIKSGLKTSAKNNILARTPTNVKKESGLPTTCEKTRRLSPTNAQKRKSPEAATKGKDAGDEVEPSQGKRAKGSPNDESQGMKCSPQTNSIAAAGMDLESGSCGVIDLCDSGSDED